jgi:hypothetical protein
MLLHCESLEPTMSQLGQKQTFTGLSAMSALPPKADIRRHPFDVRFVPIATKCTAAIRFYSITSSARANTDGGAKP